MEHLDKSIADQLTKAKTFMRDGKAKDSTWVPGAKSGARLAQQAPRSALSFHSEDLAACKQDTRPKNTACAWACGMHHCPLRRPPDGRAGAAACRRPNPQLGSTN